MWGSSRRSGSGLFSRETSVLEAGGTYLHAVAPFYAAVGTTFILSFVSQGAGRPLWPFLAGTVRLLIAAGVGLIAVDAWGADMFGLSIIVACSSIASATVCVSAARLGLIWPAPVAAPSDLNIDQQASTSLR